MTPEPGVDRPGSMDRREYRVDDEREQDYTEEPPKPGTPWGFFLVLAAIVVVAIVYSVSIFALRSTNELTAETVFGAMAACFTVIGTLVGTYFGIKAGLDGQEKVRSTLARAANRSRQRPRNSNDSNQDTRRRELPEDQRRVARQNPDQRRADREDREEWAGRGV